MAKNAQIDYDYENDVLYLYKGDIVRDSLQIENFVIDFSHDNNVVGVEIIDASNILGKLLQMDISKECLRKIENAEISVYHGKELIYILLVIRLVIDHESMDVRIPVPAPAAISMHA